MFTETENTPAEICAAVEKTKRKRAAIVGPKTTAEAQRASIAEGQKPIDNQGRSADRNPNANEAAPRSSPPMSEAPPVSDPIAGQGTCAPHPAPAGALLPDAATSISPPAKRTPHQETLNAIIEVHRLRQDMIKAMTKLSLQAQGLLRRATGLGKDDNVSGLMREAAEDPAHRFHMAIMPYMAAQEPLEAQRKAYEKALVKLVRQLPVYEWVLQVRGFGDVSFGTIVGECGDIGSYKSVAAVWKRMGLAVIGGERQRKKTGDDALLHGYSPVRRSVMWNVGNGVILGMGKWRPAFGEDVHANPELTYFQRVFAERARFEMDKLGKPVTASKTGKESYSMHAANRAKRYVEKRLLRELYKEWRARM